MDTTSTFSNKLHNTNHSADLTQSNVAAKEEIENADRIREETERLVHLSDFVKKKDAEAQEKLERAEEMTERLQEMDLAIKSDFESAEKQRHELSETRMSLARERVSLLKERARERESHGLVGLRRQPSLRRALASIKGDLNSLNSNVRSIFFSWRSYGGLEIYCSSVVVWTFMEVKSMETLSQNLTSM